MKVELGLSESAKTKRPEYSITLKVSDFDAATAVLKVLTHMQKDCREGHGSEYIMDADGDDKAKTYIDGDGGANISEIMCSLDGGEPVEFTFQKMKDDGLKVLK